MITTSPRRSTRVVSEMSAAMRLQAAVISSIAARTVSNCSINDTSTPRYTSNNPSVYRYRYRWCIALNRKLITELRSATCHMGSHSVSCHCHRTQPQPDRPVLDLPTPKGWKTELNLTLVIYQVTYPGSNHLIAVRQTDRQQTTACARYYNVFAKHQQETHFWKKGKRL